MSRSLENKKAAGQLTFFHLAIAFLFFIVLKWNDFSLDLWNDEIYSLKYFVFQSWSTVFTDYHVPNNHIFFNVLNKLYLGLFGITNLTDALAHPQIVRSINLIYVALAFICLYKFCLLIYNRSTAILSLFVLLSTIPFLNFSLEARGYMLSILLLSAILFFSAKILSSKKYYHGLFVLLLTTLFAYTSPANYLYIVALITFLSILLFFNWKKRTAYFIAIGSILLGIGSSLILYIPMYSDVFSNEYITSYDGGYGKAIEVIQHAWPHLLSYRYILLPFLLAPLLIQKNKRNYLVHILALLVFFVTPFLVNLYLQNNAPKRIFVPSSIAVAIIFAYALSEILISIKNKKINTSIVVALGICSLIFAFLELKNNRSILHQELQSNRRSQELYRNYYNAFYNPNNAVDLLVKNRQHNEIVLIYQEEPHDVPHYLEVKNIPYEPEENFEESMQALPDSAFVFARHLNEFYDDVNKNYPNYSIKEISRPYNYINLILLVRTNNK